MTTSVTHCVVWYVVLCCCTNTHHPNVPGTCVDWDSCCTAPTRTHAGALCLAECGPVPLLRSSPELPDPGPPSAAAEAPSLETLQVLSVEKDETFIYTVGGRMEETEHHKISFLLWPWPYHAAESWFLSTWTSETPRSSLVSMIFIERDSASLQRDNSREEISVWFSPVVFKLYLVFKRFLKISAQTEITAEQVFDP